MTSEKPHWWLREMPRVDPAPGLRRGSGDVGVLDPVVRSCSRVQLARWREAIAVDRFDKASAGTPDHRRSWGAVHAITVARSARLEHAFALAMIETCGLDVTSSAVDLSNRATYVASGNDEAPFADLPPTSRTVSTPRPGPTPERQLGGPTSTSITRTQKWPGKLR